MFSCLAQRTGFDFMCLDVPGGARNILWRLIKDRCESVRGHLWLPGDSGVLRGQSKATTCTLRNTQVFIKRKVLHRAEPQDEKIYEPPDIDVLQIGFTIKV